MNLLFGLARLYGRRPRRGKTEIPPELRGRPDIAQPRPPHCALLWRRRLSGPLAADVIGTRCSLPGSARVGVWRRCWRHDRSGARSWRALKAVRVRRLLYQGALEAWGLLGQRGTPAVEGNGLFSQSAGGIRGDCFLLDPSGAPLASSLLGQPGHSPTADASFARAPPWISRRTPAMRLLRSEAVLAARRTTWLALCWPWTPGTFRPRASHRGSFAELSDWPGRTISSLSGANGSKRSSASRAIPAGWRRASRSTSPPPRLRCLSS